LKKTPKPQKIITLLFGVVQSDAGRNINMCKLSCIVPVTRMAGELDTLKSWVKESINFDLEVIIVHDIQDSLTGIELQDLVQTLDKDKFKLIEKAVASPGLARNLGLKVARGHWIAFWDSDDLPQVEEVMESIAEYPNYEVIVGRYKVHNRSSSAETSLPLNKLNFWGIGENPGIWRMLFRRDLLGEMKFSSIRMAEDQVFISQLDLRSRKLVFTSRFLYTYYKGRPAQLTRTTINKSDLFTAFDQLLMSNRKFENTKDSLSLIMAARIFLTLVKNFRHSGILELRKYLKSKDHKLSKSELYILLSNIKKIILRNKSNES